MRIHALEILPNDSRSIPVRTDHAGRRLLDADALDALRGLAALYVVLLHVRWLLWSGDDGAYQSAMGLSIQGLLGAMASASRVFGFAAPPVMLFFLISGFCIHLRQARRLAEGPKLGDGSAPLLDLVGFARRRLRRLYPPLLVALLLTACVDWAGSLTNPAFYAGGATTAYNAYWSQGDHWGAVSLLGNALMQGGLAVPAFGSNGALWSLGIEFWFYALYPALLIVLVRRGVGRTVFAVLVLSAVAAVVWTLQPPRLLGWPFRVLSYWIVWLGGAVLAEAYVARVRLPGLRWYPGPGLLLLAAAAVSETPRFAVPELATTYLWSLGLWLLLANLMLSGHARAQQFAERMAGRLRFLGSVSYSLYLVHLPIVVFLSAWWLSAHEKLPGGPELALAAVPLALAAAGVVWMLVERHFVSQRGRPARPRASLLLPSAPVLVSK